MINAIELYGTLILTLIGFIIPILTILLSLFPQGTKSLKLKYENERKQSEENIASETKKTDKEKGLDYKALEKTLKSLEKNKNQAELKLQYLQPSKLLIKTAFPFLIAFIGVILALIFNSLVLLYIVIITLIASLLAFIAGLKAVFISISVLFEVGEIVNKAKDSNEEKVIELLSILVEKNGIDNLFLKENDIQMMFNNKIIKEDEKFNFSVNTKHSIPISIRNDSDKMGKNVEIGLVFPKDVLIDKTSNLSVYASTKDQIVRFNNDMIQAHENNLQGDLQITFLKAEEIQVYIFIKGENIKYRRFSFKISIVK